MKTLPPLSCGVPVRQRHAAMQAPCQRALIAVHAPTQPPNRLPLLPLLPWPPACRAPACILQGVATCQGHTLALAGTLLSEALSKGAAGLCVDDCAAHVQDTKSYPRDLVLSRHALMPLSLALATSSSSVATSGETSGAYSSATSGGVGKGGSGGGLTNNPSVSSGGGAGQGSLTGQGQAMAAGARKPLIALYATFGQTLPRGLLQAVVRNLRELLLVGWRLVGWRVVGGWAASGRCMYLSRPGPPAQAQTRAVHIKTVGPRRPCPAGLCVLCVGRRA